MEEDFDDDKKVYEIVGTSKNSKVLNDEDEFEECDCEDENCECDDEKCECHNHQSFEEIEIDILEFGLNDSDIEELISKLLELRETKHQVEFDLDEENKFIINYENDEFDDEEMGGEDE